MSPIRSLPQTMRIHPRRWRWFLGVSALCFGLHIASSAAHAGGDDARERAAKRACLAGDVSKGVGILADLYVRTNDSVYIFNQGRCFEQNGRYEEAILRFREFLLKEQDAGHGRDPNAERHIASCQALLDGQRAKDPATSGVVPKPVESPRQTEAQTPSPAPSAPVQTTSVPPSLPPTDAPSPSSPLGAVQGETTLAAPQTDLNTTIAPSRGSGLRTAGIVAAGVGVASLAAGVVLVMKANSLATEIENDTTYLRSKESTRSSYATWGQVGYGVGAACIAGGAILYYLGYAQSRDTQVALLPSVDRGAVGATLQGAF